MILKRNVITRWRLTINGTCSKRDQHKIQTHLDSPIFFLTDKTLLKTFIDRKLERPKKSLFLILLSDKEGLSRPPDFITFSST